MKRAAAIAAAALLCGLCACAAQNRYQNVTADALTAQLWEGRADALKALGLTETDLIYAEDTGFVLDGTVSYLGYDCALNPWFDAESGRLNGFSYILGYTGADAAAQADAAFRDVLAQLTEAYGEPSDDGLPGRYSETRDVLAVLSASAPSEEDLTILAEMWYLPKPERLTRDLVLVAEIENTGGVTIRVHYKNVWPPE